MMNQGWYRVRFYTNPYDYRPVKWPAPGPYWCSGYSGDDSYSIVVAYVKDKKEIVEYWPEATSIDVLSIHDELEFSDRFPMPDWWIEEERLI